jgi:uncharacterized protein YukE
MSIQLQEEAGRGDETVLRLRLATLRRNLEQVRHTEGCIAQRRSEIQELETVFDQAEGIQLTAGYVVENVDRVMKLVDQLATIGGIPQRNAERLRERLTECARDANEVQQKAEQSAKVIDTMAQRWSRLSADDMFDTHIKEIFADQAKKLIDTIDSLEQETPDVAWGVYQKDVRVQSEDLFSEYVEFLSGLALRDTGLGVPLTSMAEADGEEEPENSAAKQLGPDVYMMADDLVKHIYRIGEADLWHSLTIPARRDAAARTVARMIRLGFPEWTIWAVPLSAYEFGRVVIDRRKEIIRGYASKYGPVGHGFGIVLADSFATYALGPAYAFASVYVLLDPGPAQRRADGEERPAAGPARGDSERAFVIFRTLELMNAGEAFTAMISELRRRWEKAVEQAQGAPLPAAEAAEPLEQLTSHIFAFLRENAPRAEYPASRWQQVMTLAPLANLVATDWQMKPGKEDVRDILNAAWYQRISANSNPPDPATDRALADAAFTLWRRDLASRRQRSRERNF